MLHQLINLFYWEYISRTTLFASHYVSKIFFFDKYILFKYHQRSLEQIVTGNT